VDNANSSKKSNTTESTFWYATFTKVTYKAKVVQVDRIRNTSEDIKKFKMLSLVMVKLLQELQYEREK